MIHDGRRMRGGERARALVIFPLLLIGAGLLGWLYSVVAELVSGMPDPSYAYPGAMRFALGFGVAAAALAVSRLAGVRAAAGAVWLWLAVLGVAVAAFLPGFSPYFLLPLAVAAVAMLATARLGWATDIGQWRAVRRGAGRAGDVDAADGQRRDADGAQAASAVHDPGRHRRRHAGAAAGDATGSPGGSGNIP